MFWLSPNPASLKQTFTLLPERVALGLRTKCGFCAHPVVVARHQNKQTDCHGRESSHGYCLQLSFVRLAGANRERHCCQFARIAKACVLQSRELNLLRIPSE